MRAILACAMLLCTASVGRLPQPPRAAGTIVLAKGSYLPGSRIQLRVDGFAPPYRAALLGPGRIGNGWYAIPDDAPPTTATLVAGNAVGLAVATLRIAPPPPPDRPLIAVASYDDGIVFHDAQSFARLGILATGGPPSDVAVDRLGRVVATDTQGTSIAVAALNPWHVSRVAGAPLGDEIAVDEATHAIFVTDRGSGAAGTLARIAPDGTAARVETGDTPEGLAIDERRQIVYVANVNDGTVTAVDARTMRIVRRFAAVARVFSLALSPDGRRLYAISNQSASSFLAAPGSAVAIALDGRRPRVVARSRPLAFPLGLALDARHDTLFVTDESLDQVDVLDARTLRPKHAPLPTCRTPWSPHFDAQTQRLYVPCARADKIDVIDTHRLARVAGAPFATGSYPLAVTVWHPSPGAKNASLR